MRSVVRKWSSSPAVLIPAAVLTAANMRLDQSVDVREEGGRIIEPLAPSRHDIATLVAGVTDDNRHDPIDTGPPAGGEVRWPRPGARHAPA